MVTHNVSGPAIDPLRSMVGIGALSNPQVCGWGHVFHYRTPVIRSKILRFDISQHQANADVGVRRMSKVARSLLAFGIYLVALGLFLLIAPNTLITLFGLPETHDVWIRVVGMLLVFLAYYDIQAARHELANFFRWSVIARATVIVFFAVFVLLKWVEPILLLFGAVDLGGALWTHLALRQDRTT